MLVGEFGGRSVGTDAEGVWQRSLVAYLQANGFDYTYWCWNPNSGDTGGVLQDDWTSLNQAKLSMLQAYQWPLLGAPEPAAAARAIVAANAGPAPAIPRFPRLRQLHRCWQRLRACSRSAARSIPTRTMRCSAAGGPADPDPAHRQARQADEQRFLDKPAHRRTARCT